MAALLPLPMLILGMSFALFTASRSGSWTRTAMLGSTGFCAVGDIFLPWMNDSAYYMSGVGYSMRACYLASYALIASAFFSKSTLANGYLRRSPMFIVFLLSHCLLIGAISKGLRVGTPFELILYSVFTLGTIFSIVNTRGVVDEKWWRWAFLGVYLVVMNEVYIGFTNIPYSAEGNALYLSGQFLLVVSTGHIVRRERP
jgi:hypothetical protein